MYKAEYERCVCVYHFCDLNCISLLLIYLASDSELETSARPLETDKTRSSTRSSKAEGVTCTKLSTKGVCVCMCASECVFWVIKITFLCS